MTPNISHKVYLCVPCTTYVILRINVIIFRVYTYSGDALVYETRAQFPCVLGTDDLPTLHLLRYSLPQHKHENVKRTLPGNSHIGKFGVPPTRVVSLTNPNLSLYSFNLLCTRKHSYPSIAPLAFPCPE
jgi:hypothetical protein